MLKGEEIVRIKHSWKEKVWCRLYWSQAERFKWLRLSRANTANLLGGIKIDEFNDAILVLNEKYRRNEPLDYSLIFKIYQKIIGQFEYDRHSMSILFVMFCRNPHFLSPFHYLIFCEYWLPAMEKLIHQNPLTFQRYHKSKNPFDLPVPWNEWYAMLTSAIERKHLLDDKKIKLDPARFPSFVKDLERMTLAEFAKKHGVSTKRAKLFISGHVYSPFFPTVYQPANAEHAIWLGFTGKTCLNCEGMRIERNSDGQVRCLDCIVRRPNVLSS